MSYLPQLKEEVGILAKNPKVRIAVAVILVCLVFASGWLLRQHYDKLEQFDRDNVRTTIRNSQKLNEDSQRELDEAIQASQRAESANQDAQRATDSISDSNDELSRLNAEDQNAIERAEQVFNDIDRANQ